MACHIITKVSSAAVASPEVVAAPLTKDSDVSEKKKHRYPRKAPSRRKHDEETESESSERSSSSGADTPPSFKRKGKTQRGKPRKKPALQRVDQNASQMAHQAPQHAGPQ
ncbi:unnamed protein product, partial [Pylaiella littoralis]